MDKLRNFIGKVFEHIKVILNKPIAIKIIKFFKKNGLYILIIPTYFGITTLLIQNFFLAILVYTLTIFLALSPVGEFILRQLNNVRELYTIKEKEYLMPIFEDVYSKVEEKHPNVSQNIGIYICDDMTINAVAIGLHTVAVTQGAIETLTKEELKGLIAHEFGHIVNGDTKRSMILTIGSGIFLVFVIAFKFISFLFEVLAEMFDNSKVSSIIISVVKFLIMTVLVIPTFLIQVLIACSSRIDEFSADNFAHKIGFGRELISAFYVLQKTTLKSNDRIANKLKSTHPHIARRIGKLETAEGIEYIA